MIEKLAPLAHGEIDTVEIRPVKSVSAWFHTKERPGVA